MPKDIGKGTVMLRHLTGQMWQTVEAVADHVDRPERVTHPHGHLLQNGVARGMAIGVVDALEVVDVQDHRCEFGSRIGLFQTALEIGLRVPAVEQARERVGHRELQAQFR